MGLSDLPINEPENKVETVYQCPGESHPISRAIHLARLAGFYEPCKQCEHRHETGSFSKRLVKQVETSFTRKRPETLIRENSFRGIYLNEFDAATLSQYGQAIAAWFWNRQPFSSQDVPKDKFTDEQISVGRVITPSLVIGCDDRPHSLAVVNLLSEAIKQTGCQLIECGTLTRPCFSFATHHLNASGGLYITGAGEGPEWTGFDILNGSSLPIKNNELQEVEAKTREKFSRATRSSGSIRIFHPEVPYEAILGKYFHAIRPLKICCGLSSLRLQSFLERLFLDLSCDLEFVDQPIRHHDFDNPRDEVNQKFGKEVAESEADVGILIDEDASRCRFFDEKGRLVSLERMASVLIEHQLKHAPDSKIILEEGVLGPEMELSCQNRRNRQVITVSQEGILPTRMDAEVFQMGIPKCGRIWFHDTFPQTDAIVTLAFLLQKLSESDLQLSEVVTKNQQFVAK